MTEYVVCRTGSWACGCFTSWFVLRRGIPLRSCVLRNAGSSPLSCHGQFVCCRPGTVRICVQPADGISISEGGRLIMSCQDQRRSIGRSGADTLANGCRRGRETKRRRAKARHYESQNRESKPKPRIKTERSNQWTRPEKDKNSQS